MRIRIVWEGKTKDAGLAALQADYAKRIARFGEIVIEFRHERVLLPHIIIFTRSELQQEGEVSAGVKVMYGYSIQVIPSLPEAD